MATLAATGVITPIDGFDAERLEADPPPAGVALVETPVDAAPRHALGIAELGGVALDLSAATAYAAPVARAFRSWLVALCGTAPVARPDQIELVTHEALANAILHGNLGLHDDWRQGAAAFAERSRAVKAALGDPLRASRRVTIGATWTSATLDIRVADQGAGYSPGVLADAHTRPHRGLGMIAGMTQAMAIEDGGRMLRMTFAR